MKRKFGFLMLCFFSAFTLFGQETTTPEVTVTKSKLWMMKDVTFQDFMVLTLIVLMVALTILIIYQLVVLRLQMKRLDKIITTKDPKAIVDEPTWLENFSAKFSGLKPMSMEGELIMEDHEYDGIVELKNGMPPWLQAFFVVTIVFAISYLTYYYVLGWGPDQYTEYQMQVDKAKKQRDERNKLMASSIDENNVELSTDESDLSSGKKIFIDNCATCHKDHGGGDSGPNLTDEYWIHGGGIKNVFKTVKFGFIEKGMPGWEDKLNPLQIKQVSSFVLSLQGSNPVGGKGPQGELWKGEATTSDSTAVTTDSLKVDSAVVNVK